MLDVVLMLNSDMPLLYPKQPAFVFMKSQNDLDLSVGKEPYSLNLVTVSDVLSR
uniref:Uncharacterized protein n=1 Tax=Rhizophora mucronata TaxID=61149 RepID=A0A2P2JW58_RHIMU